MNKNQRKTLAAVFQNPPLTTIKWTDIVSLLKALSVTVEKGRGSRVHFTKGANSLHAHRPHPGKEVKPYFVKAVREFLMESGVTPEYEEQDNS